MKIPFLKNILVPVFIFLLVIFCRVFLPSTGVFFLEQWPVFGFVFLTGFFIEKRFPFFVAFLAGALCDLFSGSFFGVFILSFLSVVLVLNVSRQRLKFSSPIVFLFMLVFSALCFFGISHLLLFIFQI